MQTMQQKRANFALTKVKADLEIVSHKEYKSYASELPFMIHANGLGQAVAFYYSKGKCDDRKTHYRLYQLLSDWLVNESTIFGDVENDLLNNIIKSDMETYLTAQAEAMKLMEWVKKFAVAYATDQE